MPLQSLARVEIARALLLALDADRKKWIDEVIDYFGSGRTDLPRPVPNEQMFVE
jgi:hypothetical protein